jgi:hypothetical protein
MRISWPRNTDGLLHSSGLMNHRLHCQQGPVVSISYPCLAVGQKCGESWGGATPAPKGGGVAGGDRAEAGSLFYACSPGAYWSNHAIWL